MEHITEASLEDLPTRISYLCAFLSITSDDAAILRSAQPLITPLIPSLLNAVYTKLLSFDITAKIFVPKDVDGDGRMTMAHPQIVMRKDFLRSYLTSLLSTTDFSPTSPFWLYLDRVALMHTGQPSFARRSKRPKLQVDYIHMSLLLGHLMSLLIDEVYMLEIRDTKYKRGLLKALNKIIWVQNDLFGRHYLACAEGKEDGGSSGGEEGFGRRENGEKDAEVGFEDDGNGKNNEVVLETELTVNGEEWFEGSIERDIS